MGDAKGLGVKLPGDESRGAAGHEDPHPRAVGSPLPIGSGGGSSAVPGPSGMPNGQAPPPGRALTNSSANAPFDVPSGIQRAVSAMRAALPFVQRILPLLDGNIGTVVSNMLNPHHHAPPPPPPVNLTRIEDGLTE